MPIDTWRLKARGDDLAKLIDCHVEREECRAAPRWAMWNLAYHYLNGARRFNVMNLRTGAVTPHYLDENGNLEFQSQEVLGHIDRIVGVLNSMNLKPKVNRAGNSLGAIRDRSIAQVVADAVVDGEMLESRQAEFSHTFAALGCCGITASIDDHPSIGLHADYEVVHPREVFPFPSLSRDFTKQRGVVRQRVVPLQWLKSRFGRKINEESLKKMEWWSIEAGDVPDSHDDYGVSDQSSFGGGSLWTGQGKPDEKKGEVGVVRIRELWLWGPRGTVNRYAITSGEKALLDESFEDLEVYCPLQWARFIDTGSFWGAGAFDLLFGMGRAMERLLKSLFNNMRDVDQYGVVVLPQGEFNERSLLRDIGHGLRALNWQPDPMGEGFSPFTIQPHTIGDVPGKTAAFAKQMLDDLSPAQDLVQEKGRVDSTPGLAFLDEKLRERMSNSTAAMSRAFSGVHRYVTLRASMLVHTSNRALPVSSLTTDLAGAIIDPETSEVTFNRNRLPSPRHVTFTVKETNPRSEVARKQEAIQMMTIEGLNDPMRLILLSLREGLDFAIDIEEERAAYESIVRDILLMFGDGETPGMAIQTPHRAMPALQIRVLMQFMGGPVMATASPAVMNVFKRYLMFLRSTMGAILPPSVPNPDDILALRTEPERLARQGQLPELRMAAG